MIVDSGLESLLGALLYEGYALYPYTAGATKNATPTPFGIVYPPAYAQGSAAAFDRLRLHGVTPAGGDAVIQAEVRFLQAAPEGGHRAIERRLRAAPRTLEELAGTPDEQTFAFDGLTGRMRFSARPLEAGGWRIALCVHNMTDVDEAGLDRGAALRTSLLSTHPIVRLEGGTFVSPLEREGPLGAAVAGCDPVNTYPILASPDDDVLVGAAIVLPDHPQLAPESRGNLFDGTEIEEALVLHVMALSDDEREQIAAGDPAIRELVARTVAATPEDLVRLHGRTVLHDPGRGEL
ncbi:MAG: hypothetical protein ABJB93_07340 [Gaiellales bacterium]